MNLRIASLSLFALSLLAGCQSATEGVSVPARDSTATATPSAGQQTETKPSASAPDNHSASGGAQSATNEHKDLPADSVAKQFTPPFPDRTDLFEPPHKSAGVVRRDEEHGATVELKGFVNVNGPEVVLSIDGVISPIPEGGEKYGVQVISIKPPTVVLQRGRSRWTASLE
jgi:hypothetical protein